MDYHELSRKRQLFWTLSLMVVFLALTGSLALWRFQKQQNNPSFSNIADRAKHARSILNENFKPQATSLEGGCEGTVLIIRHCEKTGPIVRDENHNEHCSYVGTERTHFIKTLFGQGKRWPAPSYLFALTPDREVHWNFREYETLGPLSTESGVEVSIVDPSHLPSKIFELLNGGQMCGRLAVVSWKHEYIPDLATSLGCGIDEGCLDVYPLTSYDQVWQVKFVFRPELARNETDVEATTKDLETNSGLGAGRVRHLKENNDVWFVYGSIQYQHFDPLDFSYGAGDYSARGVSRGGRWKYEM